MELAKPALDVGLYTNDLDACLEFWQNEAGVLFVEMLPVGNGVRQHRHAIGDSVLKINHSRQPLPDAPSSGYRHLSIAVPAVKAVSALSDPDGNPVTLVPSGHDGIEQLRLQLLVSNLQRHQEFYGAILGLPELDATTFAVGVSQVRINEGDVTTDPEQRALGYRYVTMQVFDVKATHREIVAKGGREGLAPVRLGDVAHISFVQDPDGNWIEISQRKSIAGSLD